MLYCDVPRVIREGQRIYYQELTPESEFPEHSSVDKNEILVAVAFGRNNGEFGAYATNITFQEDYKLWSKQIERGNLTEIAFYKVPVQKESFPGVGSMSPHATSTKPVWRCPKSWEYIREELTLETLEELIKFGKVE
jgi:hypothetical protein